MPTPTTSDDAFLLRRYEATEGPLTFYQADKATVLFGRTGDDAYRKLCLIAFNKKSGAIYAQFTYFRSEPGVVGLVTLEVGPDGASQIGWKDGGKVASDLVKYSHPPDGRAHFSQDGQHQTQYWSDSLDLRSEEGHLFEIHAFHLEPFAYLKKEDMPPKRLYLPFQAEGVPNGVSVAVEWRSKQSLAEFAQRTGQVLGPVGNVPGRSDGNLFRAALLGPPRLSPLRDHVLLINVHPLIAPDTVKEPMLLFMGGWRPEEHFTAGSKLSFLSFMYPAGQLGYMKGLLGVADRIPHSSRGG